MAFDASTAEGDSELELQAPSPVAIVPVARADKAERREISIVNPQFCKAILLFSGREYQLNILSLSSGNSSYWTRLS